jgi:membrane carboxypeptidase/penicillin-binding protein PbpC
LLPLPSSPKTLPFAQAYPLNLSVVGNGGTNTVYQWFFNGDSVGVNSPNYTLPNTFFDSEGQYRVVISGSCGTIQSAIATVTLIDQTFVNNIFTTTEACGETVVNLSVFASGSNLTYQWFLDGEILEGETNISLPFDTVTFANSGLYSVAVTGTCGLATADIAELIINEVPTFSSISLPLPVCPGQPLTFSASAIGGDIIYSWTKNGVEILEEVSPTYTDAAPSDSDVYVVTAINVCGQDTAAFIAQVYPEGNPQVSQTGAATLATGPFDSYQWYLEGNLIPNATGQTLNTNFVNGNYSVVVTTADGCTDTSEVYSYIVEAITENNSLAISVYPNPAGSDLYFTLPDNITNPSVKIINTVGGLVLSSTVENRYLNIATLPAGFYTIVVQHKGQSGYYRFVKQ